MLLVHHFLLGRVVGIRMAQIATDSAPAIVSGSVLLAIALITVHGMAALSVPTVLVLAFSGLLSGVAYLAVLRLAFGEAWDDFMLVLERVAAGRNFERLRARAARLLVRPDTRGAAPREGRVGGPVVVDQDLESDVPAPSAAEDAIRASMPSRSPGR